MAKESKLIPGLNVVTDADLVYNMPTPLEVNELTLAIVDLAEFESSTKLLQDQQRSHFQCDAVEFERHISEGDVIVHSPDFENGLR
jgi:hypothetical protein